MGASITYGMIMLYDAVIPKGPKTTHTVNSANAQIQRWLMDIQRMTQVHMHISAIIADPEHSPFMLQPYVEHVLKRLSTTPQDDPELLDQLTSLSILQKALKDIQTRLFNQGCAIFDFKQGQYFCRYPSSTPIDLHWSLAHPTIAYWTHHTQVKRQPLETLPPMTPITAEI